MFDIWKAITLHYREEKQKAEKIKKSVGLKMKEKAMNAMVEKLIMSIIIKNANKIAIKCILNYCFLRISNANALKESSIRSETILEQSLNFREL